jgi:hypothetical protein
MLDEHSIDVSYRNQHSGEAAYCICPLCMGSCLNTSNSHGYILVKYGTASIGRWSLDDSSASSTVPRPASAYSNLSKPCCPAEIT